MMINILLVFLHTLSTKQKCIITARIPKYMNDQNTYDEIISLAFIFYLRALLPVLKH